MKWPLVMNEWGSACYFSVITHPGGSLDYGAGMTSCSWLLCHHIWNVVFCLLRFFLHVHAKVHSLLFPFHTELLRSPALSCSSCSVRCSMRAGVLDVAGFPLKYVVLDYCAAPLLCWYRVWHRKALFSSWKGTRRFSSNTKHFGQMKWGFKARHQIDG